MIPFMRCHHICPSRLQRHPAGGGAYRLSSGGKQAPPLMYQPTRLAITRLSKGSDSESFNTTGKPPYSPAMLKHVDVYGGISDLRTSSRGLCQ
jgi:hypothetical protein